MNEAIDKVAALGRDIGEYIRQQRSNAQISLRQLAKRAGVSNPYLSQIERGLRKPSAEILQQIAKGLRISAEALYVQAGILDLPKGGPVVDAVRADQELTERAEAARGAVEELPTDLTSLREKLDPAELRKLVDEYTEAAQKLYQKLSDAGEDALAKFRAQPQVKKALDQLEEAIATLQERVGDVAGDARELADDLLAKVTRRTRSAGEKAARTVQQSAAEVAEAVTEAGDDVAHEVRSTTRKAANKT